MTEEKYIEVTKKDEIEDMWSVLKLGRPLHKFINKNQPDIVTPEMLVEIEHKASDDLRIVGYCNDGQLVYDFDLEEE